MSTKNTNLRQITLHIPESNYAFFMELIRRHKFVKKVEDPQSSLKSKKVSNGNRKLMKDLQEAMNDVKLHREGKIKLKTAEELLNEL